MKILVLTSRLPWPLDKGDKLRAYHLIKQLSKEHEVYLFSLAESPPDESALDALKPFVSDMHIGLISPWKRWMRLLWALFSRKPFQIHWFYQRHIHDSLLKWQQTLSPDVILCQLVRMAEYVKDTHDIPRVLDYMDALSAGIARQSNLAPSFLRWIYRLEFRRLRSYEATVFDYFDGRTIISDADRKLIQHTEKQLIEVVPNGIDVAFFSRKGNSVQVFDRQKTILFTGNMSYPPNVDAAVQLVEHILPKITTPDVHVVIAGTEPEARVKQLASDRVEITGWIPDIRDAYAAADVFVAPLRIGTGQQNKILEAMSMELPCVTTQHVLRGFPNESNAFPPMLVSDSAEGIASEIDALLSDPERCLQTGQLSRAWVEKHCDWFQSAQKLEHTLVHSTVDQIEEKVWNRTTSA